MGHMPHRHVYGTSAHQGRRTACGLMAAQWGRHQGHGHLGRGLLCVRLVAHTVRPAWRPDSAGAVIASAITGAPAWLRPASRAGPLTPSGARTVAGHQAGIVARRSGAGLLRVCARVTREGREPRPPLPCGGDRASQGRPGAGAGCMCASAHGGFAGQTARVVRDLRILRSL